MCAAGRADNLIIVYKFLHLFICPTVYNHFGHIVGCHVVFNQLIGAETLLTFLTVHQRVGEAANVTGCHPCLGVHQDCTVNADILRVFLNKFLPPCFFHVIFQFYTQRAIIPCVCQTAVNFGTGVNKASVFCQCYDFFHRFYCHFNSSLQNNFFTLRRTKVIAKPTAPLLRSSRIRPIRNFAHMLRYSCRYIRQIDAVLCAGT